MSKHTPGPWELREYKQEKVVSSWNVHIGEYQVHIFPYKRIYSDDRQLSGFVQDDQVMADAHLIAAAPELLEALKALETMTERHRLSGYPISDAQKAARAAIERAEGKA
jgi:hypothetical protein